MSDDGVAVTFIEGAQRGRAAIVAARLVDADGRPIAHVGEPPPGTAPAAFRTAVLRAVLARNEDPAATPAAGVVFARRWGGGGEVLM